MTSYDYDRHSSRRHALVRDQPGSLLSPDTSFDRKQPRQHRRSVSRRREDDRRYYDERPRSAHSPAHSSDDQRSRHRRYERQTWPPQPRAESEARSLAREAGGTAQLRKQYSEEIPSRGTVDQDPIIQDVPEYVNQAERRFVMLSQSDTVKSLHTPPSSGDERKKAQRRPSRLNTNFDVLPPELQRRSPSSYGFSSASTRPARGPATGFLSPDVLTPPVSDAQRRKTVAVDSQHARSPRASPSARKGRDYFSHENAIDDTDDTSRPSSRGSFTRAGAPSQDHTYVAKHADRDARRQTDSGSSRPRGIEKVIRPLTTVAAAGALSEAVRSAREGAPNLPRSATLNPASLLREVSGGSRTASPATSIHSHRSASPPPPARLTRYSTDYSQDQLSSPDSRRASAISSRAGSRPTTPPFGNVAMPKMPQTEDDWSGYIAANMRKSGTQNKRPSGLSSTMRADSLPSVPRLSSRSGALPYPVNEGPATPDFFMPQETEHQWIPTVMPTRAMPAAPTQPRPSFTSAKDVKPPKVEPAPEIRLTKQESEAMLKRGLPGCSRPTPVAGKDDWYTLIGAPSLDFCPDCIDVFERTIYRKCFRRSPPRDLTTRIGCAFGTPWIRLAYLLSVQERLPNLKLIKELADINEECDPCPGHQVAIRTWHGLRDDQGLFVRDFNICQADNKKLQHLLPTFKNFFQRLPDNAMYEKRRCALRPETGRFTTYLDALISMHDYARAAKTPPDRNHFISLVEKKLSFRECERDAFVVGGLWHFMPALPEFTVCEDCFHEVIEPLTHKSDIARRFNRAVQPAYHEGSETGTSCQLYSPRMRNVFRIAVEDNDLKYLARKAEKRREAELRLQTEHSVLLKMASRIATGSGMSSAEEQSKKRRLERESEKVMAEWREDWE